MLCTRSIWICLTAVTLCLAGIALGKAVHLDLVDADGNTIGKANLNYAKGADKTECQMNCWDLEPETDCILLLCECDDDGSVADCIELGSFATNENGRGHLHARVDGDVSDWCVLIGVGPADVGSGLFVVSGHDGGFVDLVCPPQFTDWDQCDLTRPRT